jgi:hypothetical protein
MKYDYTQRVEDCKDVREWKRGKIVRQKTLCPSFIFARGEGHQQATNLSGIRKRKNKAITRGQVFYRLFF